MFGETIIFQNQLSKHTPLQKLHNQTNPKLKLKSKHDPHPKIHWNPEKRREKVPEEKGEKDWKKKKEEQQRTFAKEKERPTEARDWKTAASNAGGREGSRGATDDRKLRERSPIEKFSHCALCSMRKRQLSKGEENHRYVGVTSSEPNRILLD